MSSLFIDALHCVNRSRPPVWIMRQAGRYMPQYRALREKYSLWQLFHEPELAAQVTFLPIDILGVDAAILFSDILVIAEALGKKIQFVENKGPVVDVPLSLGMDVGKLEVLSVAQVLGYVQQAIHLIKRDLKVPLIGFCGGPFTVASYMIEPGAKGDLKKTKNWMYADPASFHQLLDKIADVSIAYLKMQIEAGVQAVQIFDSWANVLSYPQYQLFCLKYLKKIIDGLKGCSAPVILFSRGSSLFPEELSALEPGAISFDWQKDMKDLRKRVSPHIAVQGNLDPVLMSAPQSVIKKQVNGLIASMNGDPGFIVNLGHGVLPDAPLENVRCFVEAVKNYVPAI